MKAILPAVLVVLGQTAAAMPEPPISACAFSELTPHAEVLEYAKRVAQESPLASFRVLGRTVQNRDIGALFFTKGEAFGDQREAKPVVLIYCQQHGDEPAGKEGALLAAAAPRSDLLDKLDVILVPQVNADVTVDLERRLRVWPYPEVGPA